MSELTDYEELREKPSKFVSTVLGKEAFSYQKDFLDSGERYRTFASGRQVGKSLTCSWAGLHYAVTHQDVMVLITAPSLRQSSLLFKTLRSEMSQAGISDEAWGVKRDTQTIIEFDNGSEIHCLPTGRDGNKIRGFTADLIIVDEAAFIADSIFEDVLQPMTFATGGDILLASTPWGTSGFFYKKFTDPDWYEKQVASADSPLIDEDDIKKFKEGKTKRQIKQEVLGEFINDGSQFFGDKLIETCFPGGEPKRETDEVYLGADIAAAGADDTVFIMIDKEGNVFDKESHSEMGVLGAAKRIKDLNRMYDFDEIVVDRTGLGKGTTEELADDKIISRKLTEVYLTIQKKQAIFQGLKAHMEAGNIYLPQNRTLQLQLEGMGYTMTKSNNISIHAKDGGHDDWVDALALAVYALPDTVGGQTKGAKGGTSPVSLGDIRDSNNQNNRTESTRSKNYRPNRSGNASRRKTRGRGSTRTTNRR